MLRNFLLAKLGDKNFIVTLDKTSNAETKFVKK